MAFTSFLPRNIKWFVFITKKFDSQNYFVSKLIRKFPTHNNTLSLAISEEICAQIWPKRPHVSVALYIAQSQECWWYSPDAYWQLEGLTLKAYLLQYMCIVTLNSCNANNSLKTKTWGAPPMCPSPWDLKLTSFMCPFYQHLYPWKLELSNGLITACWQKWYCGSISLNKLFNEELYCYWKLLPLLLLKSELKIQIRIKTVKESC